MFSSEKKNGQLLYKWVKQTRTIAVIQLIMGDSDDMRVYIGCIHHGRNNISYSPSTQKAKVHLKLVLKKDPEARV